MRYGGNLVFESQPDIGDGSPSTAIQHQTAQAGPSWYSRHLPLALAVAAGFAALAIGPASASPHKASFARHARVLHVASADMHIHRSKHARRVHDRRARATSGTHPDQALNLGLVPLTNTAWEDVAISPAVLKAILGAAQEHGIPPGLLMAIAWRESRFAPAARNRRSSATGLLQFTSGTWIQAVRDFGGKHGAGDYAAAIHTSRSGENTFQGRHTQGLILKLRNDPVLSASFAADVLDHRRTAMQTTMTRNATSVDLYLVHVLGPSGMARFLAALEQRPSASVLEVASHRVLRNAGLLAYDGRPMTVANTYEALRIMLDDQDTRSKAIIAMATENGPP